MSSEIQISKMSEPAPVKAGAGSRNATGAGYAVGYARPPVATRFKRGQSGNPKGRPKRRKNLMTEFKGIVRKKVTMGDGKHKLSLAAANLLTHGVKGARGDVRSAGLFLSKTEKLGLFNEPDADVEDVNPNPIPQTLVDYLLENLEVVRLSRAEQIELSYLCKTIDKGGHVTVLSTGEFDRFKYLISKGRCTDVTPAH
jgi:Family of unknown function (DUF5681)